MGKRPGIDNRQNRQIKETGGCPLFLFHGLLQFHPADQQLVRFLKGSAVKSRLTHRVQRPAEHFQKLLPMDTRGQT